MDMTEKQLEQFKGAHLQYKTQTAGLVDEVHTVKSEVKSLRQMNTRLQNKCGEQLKIINSQSKELSAKSSSSSYDKSSAIAAAAQQAYITELKALNQTISEQLKMSQAKNEQLKNDCSDLRLQYVDPLIDLLGITDVPFANCFLALNMSFKDRKKKNQVCWVAHFEGVADTKNEILVRFYEDDNGVYKPKKGGSGSAESDSILFCMKRLPNGSEERTQFQLYAVKRFQMSTWRSEMPFA